MEEIQSFVPKNYLNIFNHLISNNEFDNYNLNLFSF